MTKRMSIAAALCAFAAAPGLAHAGSEYRVEATGSGTYTLNLDLGSGGNIETQKTEATFSWSSRLDGVRFDDTGVLQGTYVTPTQPTKLEGTVKRTYDIVSKSPAYSSHVTCEGKDVRDAPLSVSSLDQAGPTPYGLSFTPFDTVEYVDHKCPGSPIDATDIFETDGDPHALWEPAGDLGIFEQRFELPREAVGMGKIVQVVKPQQGQVLAGNCPGYSQQEGERCTATMTWSGTITFTKTATTPSPKPFDDGDDLIAPLVPAKKPAIDEGDDLIAPLVPAKTPAKTPAIDAGDDLIAPLVPAKPKVGPGAKTMTFRASCPAGCAGTAVVTAAGGTRASAAASRAALRFRVAAGGPKTVRLTLPPSVRRKLRGAKRAKLVVTMTPPKGAARKTTLTVALPRR